MKNLIFICALLIGAVSFSQAPNLMSYQAVIWDGSNNLVVSSPVGMQFSILQGSMTGTAVYVETQTPTTNVNGLASVEIGNGTVVSGDIATIDWSAGPYYLKTETDPTGGTNYAITGTTQLLSVPYALHANTVENDLDEQTLTLTGTDLSISNGNQVDLSPLQDGVDDADADPMNEYNLSMALVGTNLMITDLGGTLTADLSSIAGGGGGTQTLSFTSPNLTLSGGNTVDLSALQDDADADPTNEIQTISQAGNVLTLSNGGGSVTVAPSLDDDPTNELQDLSLSNDTLYISDGTESYIGPENTQAASLLAGNNFGGAFGSAKYYKQNDRVYLSGVVDNVTPGTVVINLPAGYQPASAVILPVAAEWGSAMIIIQTSGTVTFDSTTFTNSGWFSLDGVSFRISN
ncbi:hypothetical protein K6119_13595 [Paracrocinitomix mangrovi]|uniref:hypothetical protein n=1 Tax=Paracrocinitomix mangrovi TaxID=2862509 RepID=UPI001C8DF6CE|nr:hypothetical protein [Paracrocinitomix mangrovi]UKN00765.1 hypothetical protein K6119_13595 [Paracrocinitomix mangrovi]